MPPARRAPISHRAQCRRRRKWQHTPSTGASQPLASVVKVSIIEPMAANRGWENPDNQLIAWIETHRGRAIDSYRANALLVEEHGRQEDSFRTGGYAHRQVLELVQNAADALRRAGERGHVELVLNDDVLYCANEGAPFAQEGLEAICHAYLSDKRGDEIGRFGLGFKSVLGVTDEPTILSRSVSFGFRADLSREELSKISPIARNFPILRLPVVVDAEAEIAADPNLEELAEWAQTIVRLPLTRDLARLIVDLRDFPKEFLLFAPSVESLRVVDHPDGSSHEYQCNSIGDHKWRLVGAEGATSDWMVWHQVHRPSAEALEEVGEAIRRPEVTVTYAAPLDEAQALGRFWAYFPLQDITSARGIHNAPWRINDDRTNLLEGQFNEELLQVVAELLVNALPHLNTEADPARHFDYLPARGREAQNFADRRLTELVPAIAATTASVPDAHGNLRFANDLVYPHLDLRLEPESFVLWSRAPGRPLRSPHWTCFTTPTRRARIRTLIRRDEARAADVEIDGAAWLERIVADATDEQSEAALQVYFSIKDDPTREELIKAAVIPDLAGRLGRLNQTDEIFLRGDPLSTAAGLRLVRRSFLELRDVEPRLRALGLKDVDPKHELRRLATTAANRWRDAEWKAFWDLVLEVSSKDAEEILLDHVTSGSVLKVRCRDGSWQHVGAVVVPGLVEPTEPSLAADAKYHESHLSLLKAIGVGTRPVVTTAAEKDLTRLEYLRRLRPTFLAKLPIKGRQRADEVNWAQIEGPAPLHVLRRFSDTGDVDSQMVWTQELLEIDVDEERTLWYVHRSERYTQQVVAPHLWAAATYGLIDTSWGARPSRSSLHPDLQLYDPLLPVAKWQVARKIPTISKLDDIPVDMWREYLGRIPTGGSPEELGRLMVEAGNRLPAAEVPTTVPCVKKSNWDLVSPQELLIAVTDAEAKALREQGLPFVAIADENSVADLIDRWGCQPASSTLRVEVLPDTPGEPVVLLDRFRRLRDYSDGRLDDMELVGCTALLRVVTLPGGTDSHTEEFAVADKTIFYENAMPEEDLVARISAWFDLGLDPQTIVRVLNEAEDERVQAAMAACRAEKEPAKKLLALLPVETLEASLPAGLLTTVRDVSGDGGPEQVAELLTLVHGYSVLIELKHDLQAAGYRVPSTWAGSSPAVGFVRNLGFPTEYAGERGGQLDADMTVLGPPNMKPLHEYQDQLAAEIRVLVRMSQKPERALLFLPTGAGKTRVTVQALVQALINDEITGPVLWIAQTEELCEQAVQTWSTVWREFGNRPLRLCRLWSSNEVASSDADASVIVATDAKLDRVRERTDYDWLLDTAAVVIDEAHGATGVGITATLKWLGIDGRKTTRPLLGLTATPFKGTGEEANKRLAARFGGRQLNVLGPDPYGELQRLGVLARVKHKVLPGSTFSLDISERAKFETFRDVPNSVLERVGRDPGRTIRLLEDIAKQPADWPVLVFTSSVLGAQTLSALLRVHGIRSGTVSGSTPAKERRRTIEAFRNGDIRVLTNCNVLTQGFDAPAVRALYIARPTFSPNAYIQMVGRGLRGPANGGKEECLIVNVADTFEAFGETLAYKEFDYLWRLQGGDTS